MKQGTMVGIAGWAIVVAVGAVGVWMLCAFGRAIAADCSKPSKVYIGRDGHYHF